MTLEQPTTADHPNPHSPLPTPHSDDLLWKHLKTLPAFRAVLRAIEARFYHQVPLPEPVLDLGCGDGNFIELTFGGRQLAVGLDPWWNPLRKAYKANTHQLLLQGMGDQMPFPDGHFASAISNSVLEHIPDIQPVLNETGRVLQMGGRFLITMPNHRFTERLWGAQFFERLKLPGMADRYRKGFNFISRHQHTESAEWWCERLAEAGLAVERWQYYFSEKALHALEIGHAQGLPSAALHALTGQWILAPTETNLALTERWLRPFYNEEAPADGTYVVILARKVANHPIAAQLPAAEPFSLSASQPVSLSAVSPSANQPEEFPPAPLPLRSSAPLPSAPPPPIPQSPFRIPQFLYLLAALLTAVWGQMGLAASAETPLDGLRWFGWTAAFMGLFAWSQRTGRIAPLPAWPGWAEMGRRYGAYAGGLILAWVGYRFGLAERPFLALTTWLLGGATAFYALWPAGEVWPVRPSRTTLLTALGLFGGAWLIRTIGLSSHPFILSGTEANLGLASLSLPSNPFGTGWLTNPTLGLYLMALPVRLLGRTALALRLLSPLVGAATVAAVYLIGQKIWGRAVGVGAAVLLLASHTHLHYSRLGMTNIWDPLVLVLGLGLLAVAWQEQKRGWYLLAGLFLGLNAYFLTSNHLLPFVLLAWLGGMALLQREALWGNGRHLLATFGLALVVALPHLLYLNANPTIFWERTNSYGIFPTGWVAGQLSQGQPLAEIAQRQVWSSLLAYQATADVSTYYRPGQPLLGFWPALAFGVGLILALWHGRKGAEQMLIWWVLLTAVLGGVLLLESPSSHRFLVAIPPACWLAALALDGLVRAVLEWWEEWDGEATTAYRPYQWAAVAVLAVVMVAPDALFYFGPYRAAPGLGDPNTEIAHEVGTWLQTELTGTETVYFMGAPVMFADFPTITFLGESFTKGFNLFDVEPLHVDAPAAVLPPRSAAMRFVLIPARLGDLAALQAAYPGGRVEQFAGYYADPLFTVYSVD